MKNESSISVATHEIFSLNHKGVELIKNRDYNGAFSVFARGAQMAKRIILLSGNADHDVSTTVTRGTPACAFFTVLQDDTSIASNQQFFARNANLEGQPMVFNRPLSILTSRIPSNILYLAFIQIYNLALSVHLSTLEQDRVSTTDGGNKNKELLNKRLHRALTLYSCAFEMNASGMVQLSLIEQMALVNNLGHVHYALKNDMHSQDCFLNLMNLLHLLKEETSSKDRQMSKSERELYDGFVENALSCCLFLHASLPAAAA